MTETNRPAKFQELPEYEEAVRKAGARPGSSRPRADAATLERSLAALSEQGFVIVEGLCAPDELSAIREEVLAMLGPIGRNSFEGFQTQRVYGVMARTLSCNPLVEHPLVLDLLDSLLLPNYLLSQLVAINILPGQEAQLLHHDDALYPLPRPRKPVSVATIWALDDFTEENGGTRVIPGSHRWGNRTPTPEDLEQAISVEMPAGSMVFFLGTLWHGGGANVSQSSRLCVTAQYCEPWCRTVENFSLSMSKPVVRRCSEDVQRMLGYNIHSALMGYVDGRHPKHLLSD
jgi:hypothetical protein